MSKIEVFEHEQFGKVRVIDRDGNPWFVGNEPCRALGFANPSDAIKHLDDDEKALITNPSLTNNPNGKVYIISEPGLYSLILRSRKPEAKAFKRWITHVVLPSIRKTGKYGETVPKNIMVESDQLIALVKRIELAEECIDLIKPRTPIGTISKVNGRPRNQLIPAYPRASRLTIEIPTEYRHLFNYLQMTNQQGLLEDGESNHADD